MDFDIKHYATPLRFLSLAVAGIGMLLAHEVERRETEAAIDDALDRREMELRARIEMEAHETARTQLRRGEL